MIGTDPKIPDAIKGQMTPLERELARRVHNQRVRIRQLEMFKGWQKPNRPELIKAYRGALETKHTELKRLKARGFWSRLFNLNK